MGSSVEARMFESIDHDTIFAMLAGSVVGSAVSFLVVKKVHPLFVAAGAISAIVFEFSSNGSNKNNPPILSFDGTKDT